MSDLARELPREIPRPAPRSCLVRPVSRLAHPVSHERSAAHPTHGAAWPDLHPVADARTLSLEDGPPGAGEADQGLALL